MYVPIEVWLGHLAPKPRVSRHWRQARLVDFREVISEDLLDTALLLRILLPGIQMLQD